MQGLSEEALPESLAHVHVTGMHWRSLLIFVAGGTLALTACGSHRQYQLGQEARAKGGVVAVAEAFAGGVSKQDPGAIEPVLDVEGRVALLQLLQWAAVEDATSGGISRDDLLTAAALLGLGEGESVFTEDELESTAVTVLRERLAEELELDPAEQALVGLILGKRDQPSAEDRREELLQRLRAEEASGCSVAEPQISYSADILRHIDGPSSEGFEKWRERIEAAHLIALDCDEERALVLVTQYEDREAPRIAGWQFFSDEEWAVVEEKLKELVGE